MKKNFQIVRNKWDIENNKDASCFSFYQNVYVFILMMHDMVVKGEWRHENYKTLCWWNGSCMWMLIHFKSVQGPAGSFMLKSAKKFKWDLIWMKKCVYVTPSFSVLAVFDSRCATAAVMLRGVWRNLHSVLYCLWYQNAWGSCGFVGSNYVQQLGLDTRANIGFGPGHTSGQWVNSPLRQPYTAAQPCTGQPAISALHLQQNIHTYRHPSIVHSSLWRPTC